MTEEMGMTNKQFNGFIRLVIKAVKTALDSENPKKELENLLEIFNPCWKMAINLLLPLPKRKLPAVPISITPILELTGS